MEKLTLTKILLTDFSLNNNSKAFLTASLVAPPPTSKKLAGLPPTKVKTSQVAILFYPAKKKLVEGLIGEEKEVGEGEETNAKPAPFTKHPTEPSNLIKLRP